VVADPIVLSLPKNISPGSYALRVGMYLPPDNRLQLFDATGQPLADFVDIGTLNISN
jgi:hypothetical protein